jgi:hypothetical protein
MVDGNLVAICEIFFEIEDCHLYQRLTTLPYYLLLYWTFRQIYGKFIKRFLSHCVIKKSQKNFLSPFFKRKNHHNEKISLEKILCPRVRALSNKGPKKRP